MTRMRLLLLRSGGTEGRCLASGFSIGRNAFGTAIVTGDHYLAVRLVGSGATMAEAR